MAEGGQSARNSKENIAEITQSQQQPNNQECVETHESIAIDDSTDPELRRSQITRKLTERGKELQDEKLSKLKNPFQGSYEKWKALARNVRHKLMGCLSNNMLQALIGTISAASKDLNVVYQELRQNVSPGSDIRHRIDTCSAVTKKMVESAWSRLGEGVEGQDPFIQEECCTYTGSVFSSIASKSSHGHSRSSSQSLNNLSVSSRGSSLSSAKKQEAAAEIAATEATLEILQQQEHEIEELQRLESEEKRRVAEQEAEAYKHQLEREEEESRLRVKFEAENAARREGIGRQAQRARALGDA